MGHFKNAGFSISDELGYPVEPNYKDINVEWPCQSEWNFLYLQKLLRLAKLRNSLVDADFELLGATSKVFAYIPLRLRMVAIGCSQLSGAQNRLPVTDFEKQRDLCHANTN